MQATTTPAKRLRRRAHRLAAPLVVLTALAGCGGDDATVSDFTAHGSRGGPSDLTLRQFRHAVEQAGVDLTWGHQANSPDVLGSLDPRPVDHQEYATPGSRHLQVLEFAGPAAARAAWDDVVHSDVIDDGGAAARARNLIVVLPRPPLRRGPYRVIWDTVRGLAPDGSDASIVTSPPTP